MSKIYVDEIRPKTSGAQVKFPEKPAFNARLTASETSADYSAVKDLVCGNAIFDIGNNYNTSTGKFTAPVDGVYQFHARARTDGANPSYLYIVLYLNGSVINESHDITNGMGTNQHTSQTTALVQLSAGDVVNPKVRTAGDSSITVDINGTGFSGFLVG